MNAQKPPEGLAQLAWASDRVFLLFSFRFQARWRIYHIRFTERQIGLSDKDFQGLPAVLARRSAQIEKEPLLYVYWKTNQILDHDPLAPELLQLIEDQLAALQSFEPVLPLEDYIDNLSAIDNYCAHCTRQGNVALEIVAFRARLLLLEGKYGKHWRKTPYLPLLLFTNLALNAVQIEGRANWRYVPVFGLSEDVVVRGVGDWLEGYIKGYQTRVEKQYRKSAVAYIRARLAFAEKDFPRAAKEILKVEEEAVEVLVLSIRRLLLMTWYELRYCSGDAPDPMARKLLTDPRATLKTVRERLRDLVERQGTLHAHSEHFLPFINAFATLLTLRDGLEKMPPEGLARSKYLYQPRKEALEALQDYIHESGDWLREKFNALA
ncbi:hypothetical protein QWY85_04890 [Neolewinella lacunae]|uniref:Uncharacterized protein n=1 Tax=Neolewinella lacunae TaxID=1517758 RepID=A0A923TEP3_9BACT|nr:hypothetical protein [Neolewinella lacunae]MBC6996132.1 hypothetical protein [Neolewinella lacunae]MDN3633985.1 hypothetical protein [Neolewinella lacunae]